MKTENLIHALVTDADDKPARPLGRALALGLLPALAVSLILYALLLGPRPHLAELLTNPRVIFKLLFPLALLGCASVTALRLMRPASNLRLCIVLFGLLAAILVAAVVTELMIVPRNLWMPHMMGHYARYCVVCVPLLAAAPLVAAFIVLRRGAPTRPAWAGAGVGLFAAAIGAAIYATHCPDDSPLFLALWYGLGITFITALGAIGGRRFLRW